MPHWINFGLSLAALFVGMLGGAFFLGEYARHPAHRTAFFWGVGLLALFLFQVPTVLFTARVPFIVSQFDLFFSLAFPISFLGLMAIYIGLRALRQSPSGKFYGLCGAWVLAAFLFFNYYFYINHSFSTRAPLYSALLLFFLPLNLLNIWTVFRLKINRPGAVLLLLSFLCGVWRNFIFLQGFARYPLSLWFLALQPPLLFWLQLIGSFFLLAGFLFIHRHLLTQRRS